MRSVDEDMAGQRNTGVLFDNAEQRAFTLNDGLG
jgi:hypothetical protein